MTVELNISRLRYLLSLYGMEDVDLLSVINRNLKRQYRFEQVFSENIDLKILKKIDKLLFNKGLSFYIDPSPIEPRKEMSVFFRKKRFGETLNFTAKKVVNDYELLKNYLSSLDKLSDVRTTLTIPHWSIKTSPKDVAQKVRELIYPKGRCRNHKDFLRSLIGRLADNGILVFEYIEPSNKKEKANLDGFFLRPNFIVLKRYSYYKREIFTLLHELGHYILNKEEIERLDSSSLDFDSMSEVERWCNDFAFYFLVGDYAERINAIEKADGTNDYQFPLIDKINADCCISRRAIFTRLFYDGKMTRANYTLVINDLNERYKQRKSQQNTSEFRASAPRPIYSPKFLSTLSIALNDGIVRPVELYRMKIPAKVVEGLSL